MRAILLLFFAAVVPASELKESDAASWVVAQGGTVDRDGAGHVTGVNLRAAWITDTDLGRLADLTHLGRLDLSLTHITDLGMERLAPLNAVAELNLSYAEHITDAG